MSEYSKLSKVQKVVFDTLRQGGELYYDRKTNSYKLFDQRGFAININYVTGRALDEKHYIVEMHEDGEGRIHMALSDDKNNPVESHKALQG